MALHVAAHGEGLAAAGVRAAEGLLAGVAVGVDAQRGRAAEGLVAGAADVAVLVLGVGGCCGRGEVVVVLPGRGDWGDEGVCGGVGGGWGGGWWCCLVVRLLCGFVWCRLGSGWWGWAGGVGGGGGWCACVVHAGA